MPSGRDVEEYLAVKYQLHRAEKRAIALAAAKQIVEGDIILIGGGSTTYELAKLLRQAKNIHVITTSVPIAYELYSHPNIEVEMVGGLINRQNGVATSHHAVNHLSSIHVRKAFLGADSISLEHGITTPSYFEAEIEKVVIQNSDKVFILTDHSKFNKISLTPLAKLQEIYAIITDNSSDEAYLRQIEAKGPKIIRT
jgi:DeoR/GlpR family transcriptional regulator of sugar metabolism